VRPSSRMGLAHRANLLSLGRVVLAHVGQVTQSIGWLTDPNNGSMSLLPRVINSMCIQY
jgi:hypothetical protein